MSVHLKRKRTPSDSVDLYEEVLEDAAPKAAKVLDIEALAKTQKKTDQTGVVYVSRIPPGMGPAKLKHILSQYGETGRVYLARDPKDTRKQSKNKQRHQSYRFVEGWIEFEDKKVARHVADLLNAKTIGGKPSSPFYHDIWTLKYLPKFKWNLLSAGLAQQHAREAALFRNEISQSKKAQSQYLGQVERGRVHQKIKEKRAAAAAGAKEGAASEDADSRTAEVAVPSASSKPSKKARAFEQRQTIQKQRPNSGKPDAALQGVLDSLF